MRGKAILPYKVNYNVVVTGRINKCKGKLNSVNFSFDHTTKDEENHLPVLLLCVLINSYNVNTYISIEFSHFV